MSVRFFLALLASGSCLISSGFLFVGRPRRFIAGSSDSVTSSEDLDLVVDVALGAADGPADGPADRVFKAFEQLVDEAVGLTGGTILVDFLAVFGPSAREEAGLAGRKTLDECLTMSEVLAEDLMDFAGGMILVDFLVVLGTSREEGGFAGRMTRDESITSFLMVAWATGPRTAFST